MPFVPIRFPWPLATSRYVRPANQRPSHRSLSHCSTSPPLIVSVPPTLGISVALGALDTRWVRRLGPSFRSFKFPVSLCIPDLVFIVRRCRQAQAFASATYHPAHVRARARTVSLSHAAASSVILVGRSSRSASCSTSTPRSRRGYETFSSHLSTPRGDLR